MNEQKGLLTRLGEMLDQYRAERRGAAQEQMPSRHPGWLRRLLPTPGNVLFTLLVVAGLIWANSVGALPLRTSTAASTSTGTIAYQGRLADADGTPITDTVNMEFRLYDVASGGIFLWEELWTGSNSVQVSDGLFNVMLGSMEPIPQSVITEHDSLFLGITVGTDDEMTPRVQLGSVPFAVQALTVPDGSVTTEKIADEAVTQAKLGADVSLEPPDGSITTAKLADDAVTSSKIAHQFGASDKPLLNFVVREDPPDWDWHYCWPLGWSDWDLSSIVGDTAVMVQLHVSIDGARGIQAAFRKNGKSGGVQEKRVISQNNDPYGYQIDVVVECDPGQIIERAVVAGEGGGCVNAVVVGWWEPAHQ